jgi:hypothetical protein
MSGWTSQVLGVPTLDWLTEHQQPIPANEFKRRAAACELGSVA